MSEKLLNSLETIKPESSGVKEFNLKDYENVIKNHISQKPDNYSPDFFRLLGLLLRGNNRQISEISDNHPELIATVEIKAVCILSNIILTENAADLKKFFFRKNPDPLIASKINHKLASTLIDLFTLIYKNTDVLKLFDHKKFFMLGTLLPEIKIYLALKLIFGDLDFEMDALELINSFYVSSELDEQMQIYTLVRYYKKIGDEQNAEIYLNKYRRWYSIEDSKPVEMQLQANEVFYRPEQTLENWKNILNEIDEIQDQIVLKAGLQKNTCEYFKCSDCCKFTFPVLSQTEFLYLKNWMLENKYDIDKIVSASQKIQAEHEELFGTRLKVLDKSLPENQKRGAENPNNFKYQCPFLDERGSCSCYSARPILCRGFGLSSDNGLSIKTCNYYLAQYRGNCSPENERYVFDLRNAKTLARASDLVLKESEHRHLSGTLVAWFTGDYLD